MKEQIKESQRWGVLAMVSFGLSFLTCGIMGIPSIIFGVIGLCRDTRKNISIVAIVLSSLGVAFTAPMLYRIFVPLQVKEALTYVQAGELKYIDHPLPETSSNIWAYYEWGPTIHDYRLRFEAPHEDRLRYARMLMSKHPGSVWEEPEYFQLIREDGTYYTDRLFEKLPWWDIHTAYRSARVAIFLRAFRVGQRARTL